MPDAAELPRYRCHKQVCALKISEIILTPDGKPLREGFAPIAALLVSVEPGHQVSVSQAFLDRHKPEVGGYFVKYDDGYESYSPAKAFEDGYTRID